MVKLILVQYTPYILCELHCYSQKRIVLQKIGMWYKTQFSLMSKTFILNTSR